MNQTKRGQVNDLLRKLLLREAKIIEIYIGKYGMNIRTSRYLITILFTETSYEIKDMRKIPFKVYSFHNIRQFNKKLDAVMYKND